MARKEPRIGMEPWGSTAFESVHPAVRLIPYALLAFGFLLTELGSPERRLGLLAMGVLCLLAAAWIFCWVTVRNALVRMGASYAVFYFGLIPVLVPLAYISGWFGFFAIIGYGYALRLPWRWRLPGVWAMAAVAATAQTSPIVQKHTIGSLVVWLIVFVLNAAAMSTLAWFLQSNAERDSVREDSMTELAEANRKLEATLAENAGLHAQLLTQAREAGVHDERRRMAREIHDTLAQGLTGIITQLQAAEQVSDDPAGWRRHFAAAQTLARESLAEARRSVHALRPEPLEAARLSDALAEVAARWETLHGIPVQVTITGDERPLPSEAEVVLLRTGQEALANVAKHAEATRVGLTISYMEHEVALDVRDDGKGFDPSGLGAAGMAGAADGHGFGLVAMRQRVEGLHGTLQVESEPGTGTAISACLPVAGPVAGPVPERVPAEEPDEEPDEEPAEERVPA
jgi:signal transduction histidine kinase